MEKFSQRVSRKKTNRSSSITTTGSSSSSNSSPSPNPTSLVPQQNMGYYPQNVNFPHHNTSGQLGFPTQQPYYLVPYDHQNMQFQNVPSSFPQVMMNQAPLYPLPTGQSGVPYGMPNSEVQGFGEKEKNERVEETWKWKVNREFRRQVRQQRSQNPTPVAPSVPEGTRREQSVPSGGGSKVKITVKPNRPTKVFYTPDGKMLEEILTKHLRNSDVSVLGRIVLPKRDAEDKLPALLNKEGIDIVLKDVYSGMEWSIKYRYWTNNLSRMYVLENAGDFVNHYKLQTGDSIILYEDELKNLYVRTKKVQRNVEQSVPLSNMGMMHPYGTQNYKDEADAYLAYLIKEFSHKREAEAAANKSLLINPCMNGGGSSSSGTKKDNIVEHQFMLNNVAEEEEAPNQAPQLHQFMPNNNAKEEAPNQGTQEAAAAAPQQNNNVVNVDDDDAVYGDLDNIFEIGHNYYDLKMW